MTKTLLPYGKFGLYLLQVPGSSLFSLQKRSVLMLQEKMPRLYKWNALVEHECTRVGNKNCK